MTKQVELPEEVRNRFFDKWADKFMEEDYPLLDAMAQDYAQAQQEAVSAERERIKQIVIKMQDRATEEECWRALKELEETLQKEQE